MSFQNAYTGNRVLKTWAGAKSLNLDEAKENNLGSCFSL